MVLLLTVEGVVVPTVIKIPRNKVVTLELIVKGVEPHKGAVPPT